MVLIEVIEEGDVLLIRRGPTAGAVASLVLLVLCEQPRALHERQRQVIVFATSGALSAAVMEDYSLVTDVAQPQLTDSHLHLSQRAGFGSLFSPFSPFALLGISTGFPFHQCPNDLLQLAFCEALEHLHD